MEVLIYRGAYPIEVHAYRVLVHRSACLYECFCVGGVHASALGSLLRLTAVAAF